MPNMNKDDEITRRVCERVEALGTFFKDAEYEALTPEEQEEYINTCFDKEVRRRALIRREEKGRVEGLEEGRAEGEAAGLEKGRAEGEAAGLKKGRAEGRAEGEKEKSLAIALAMKAEGISAELIAKCTGLAIEEIEHLG